MKKNSFTSKTFRKFLIIPASAILVFALGSCNKNENLGAPSPCANTNVINKSQKMRASVSNALNVFAKGKSGGRDFSDPAYNYTTYSTPSANVYQWSDPSTGTTFSLAQSTGGAGGLGQLAYNNKSFEYNYVFSIKASGGDPAWDGFLSGRDLRGVVAIDADGEITDDNFLLKNFAIFLVATTNGTGTYEFNNFNDTALTNSFAIGEIIDLSDMQNASLSSFADGGKVLVTSGGHVIVSETDFTMGSDAKIMDVITSDEFSLEGSIMFE